MKTTLTILITFIATCVLIFGGCNLTSRYIISCKTCEQFNIDNFELRTFTDIKNGSTTWCNYDDKTGIKTVKFEMKIPPSEFRNYVSWSGFNSADSSLSFKIIPAWNDSIHSKRHNLFYKKGSYDNDSWTMILDSNTGTLWAELLENK